jgi:hypothetical protein
LPETDDTQLVGMRVDPAALDVEAGGDLAGVQQSVCAGLVIATEQLGDLTRDRRDARVVQHGLYGHSHLTTPA